MKKTSIIIAFLALATSAQADFEAITGKRADTIRVTNAADNGEGTLREALSIAKKGAVVLLEKDIVIKPHSGEYIINKIVKIKAQGRGAIINAVDRRCRILNDCEVATHFDNAQCIASRVSPVEVYRETYST